MLYFDHNASTCLAPEVQDTFASALRDIYGNASSTHRQGQIARQKLESSRRTIAEFINASPADLVFTSGGTESNNLAILGLARSAKSKRKHIITTTIEHPSVLEPCRQLEREGVEITYVGANATGVVKADEIRSKLRDDTVLVSVIHANNETGAMQPIASIARIVRERRQAGQTIFLHSDGVQALGKVEVNIQELGGDLYSLSAHKIFGPKGVGALFVRKGTPVHGVQFGGRQERERRAGTENVPAILAFARATELCHTGSPEGVSAVRDYFEQQLVAQFEVAAINCAGVRRLPNTSNVLFHGISGEALVIALDMKGMAVSTGSACSSGSVEPSHVLLAMGLTPSEAQSSIRFSFGRYNTTRDVDLLIEALRDCIGRLKHATLPEKRVAV